MNRRHPPARSPTPPTRVIKSTYGGNLFTSDDVLYLKKYIDYCQEQGLVLRSAVLFQSPVCVTDRLWKFARDMRENRRQGESPSPIFDVYLHSFRRLITRMDH